MSTCRKCGAGLDSDGTCAVCLLSGAFGQEFPAAIDGGNKVELETEGPPYEALEYDRFGPYRILRLLGEGGMGTVYLAEQLRPLHRTVALKVVKLGLNSSQILSRFNHERQALALMDHPNIAHVYDAGASEKGRPYFVMEYVDGIAITQYCDEHRLNTNERLELFLSVCEALQHAHQKGVIHRDIKPSNVMVTRIDGRAIPKVIDFGIARVTDQFATGETALTQLGQFIGTPEYMSPEQTDLVTGDIDTSSDVYSLGVLLYELLVGAVPFDPEKLRMAGLSELLRIIREDDAIPMTARLTGMGESAREIAIRRHTDPATLRRLVSGDLNWIATRAMQKDRRRRYPSASELAADIRRHLEHQPVLAGPPVALYRARKFVRRYRGSVIAAALVVFALVAGIVAITWQAAIASRERAQAITARTLAEARLNDIHALAGSMLFEVNDEVKDLAGATRARETLIRIGQQYLNKKNAAGLTDARSRRELAEAFLRVGDLQGAPGESNLRDLTGARESYSRSVAILEPEVVSYPHDPRLRHLLTNAYVRQARLEENAFAARTFGSAIQTFSPSLDQYDDSSPSVKSALDRAWRSAEIYGEQWPDDIQGLRDRCEALQAKKEFASAVALRQRIFSGNPNDPVLRWELAHAELELGSALVLKNRKRALHWLQTAAGRFDALAKEDRSNVRYQRDQAVALGTMTRVLVNLGRLGQALASARQSVAILEQLTAADRLNASFRFDLSAARVALSNAYYNNGQTAAALENVALAASLQQEQAARYPDNPDFPRQAAFQYRNSGRFKSYSRDLEGSLAEYRKAEAIDRKLVRQYPARFEFSEALREDLDSIGDALLGLDDKPSALRAYRDALSVANASAVSQLTAESLAGLAAAHQSTSNGLRALALWDEAILEGRASVGIWERRLAAMPGNQSLQRARSRALEELSKLYEGRGDYVSAVNTAEKARPFLEADFHANADDESALTELRNALSCLRVAYARLGDYNRAISVARDIVELARKTGVISRSTANRDLGESLLVAGLRKEGVAALRRAASILDESFGDGRQYTFEDEPSPYFRNELASTLLSIANAFPSPEREGETALIMKRLLPAVQALVRDNPGNNLYRDTLIRASHAGSVSSPAHDGKAIASR